MCAAAPAAAVTFNDLVSEAQRLTDEQCAKTLLEACCEATLCTRPAAMDDAGAGFASRPPVSGAGRAPVATRTM